jgi:hypothetical protein
MNNVREQKLRESLLEIEWRSRRRPTGETLAEVNNLARAALTGTYTSATADAADAVKPIPDYVRAPYNGFIPAP